MDDFLIARILHIIGVVFWIGGVAMVTTVVIPAAARELLPEDRLRLFFTIEHRFVGQARFTTLLTGLSGFYMLHLLDAWDRFQDPGTYWWIIAMFVIWLLFTVVIFILEPLFLKALFHKHAEENPDKAIAKLRKVHITLLTASLITILGGVAGVHG